MNLMKWCLIGCSIGWTTAALPSIINGRANAGTAIVGVVLVICWITYALMLGAPTTTERGRG